MLLKAQAAKGRDEEDFIDGSKERETSSLDPSPGRLENFPLDLEFS